MTLAEWLASQNTPIHERERGPYVPRGRIILWHQIAIAKGAQLGFSKATFEAIKARAKPSRRLRWPIGRAKPFEPWIATSQQVEHGSLTEAMSQVLAIRQVVNYNHKHVDVIERMARRAVTATNKRQGWTPDGQSLEAGA